MFLFQAELVEELNEALDDILGQLEDVLEERTRLRQLQYQRELVPLILRGTNQLGAVVHPPNVIPSDSERARVLQEYSRQRANQLRDFKEANAYFMNTFRRPLEWRIRRTMTPVYRQLRQHILSLRHTDNLEQWDASVQELQQFVTVVRAFFASPNEVEPSDSESDVEEAVDGNERARAALLQISDDEE